MRNKTKKPDWQYIIHMKLTRNPILLILMILLSMQLCKFSDGHFTNRSLLHRLSGMEYQIDKHVVKLENGEYIKEILPGTASLLRVNLSEWLILGDLNYDSQSDAAVILTTNMGGTGKFYYLIPVLRQADNPVALEAILLGDRISMVSLNIENQQISVVYLDRNSEDSMTSTPGREIQRRFSIINSTVTELNEPTISLSEYVRVLYRSDD